MPFAWGSRTAIMGERDEGDRFREAVLALSLSLSGGSFDVAHGRRSS